MSSAPAPGSGWRVDDVSGRAALAAMEALAPEWAALGDAAGAPPFLQPGWVRAQVAAFENPRHLRLCTVRGGQGLAAVLVLIAGRGWFRGLPVRRLRGAASVHSLRFDVLAVPGEAGKEAAHALGEHLCQRGGWDLIELRDVAAGGVAEALLAAARKRGCRTGAWLAMQSPCIDLTLHQPAALAPGLRDTSGSFRIELRRSRRRLLEQARRQGGAGNLVLARAPTGTPAEVTASLEAFYRLERSGWKGAHRSAIACHPRWRLFYTQAALAMAAAGRLVLHRLELDGRLLAMSYSLASPGSRRYDVVKWAYDETYARFGPGHLLIEAIAADGAARGIESFHINGPSSAYKRKWTKRAVALRFLYVFRPGGYGGLLYRLKFVWTPALKNGLRRRRERGDTP